MRLYRLNRTRLIVAAAGLFLFFGVVSGAYNTYLQTRTTTLQAQVDSLAATAAEAAAKAAYDSAQASLALDRAKAAEQARDVAQAKLKQARSRADTVIAAAPDTCLPVIAALDALAGGYLEALHVEIEQHDSTKSALYDAQAALADAQRALAGLSVKAGEIDVPRRSWLAALLPQTGVGCAAGLSPITRRADVVCGATLGWKVSL